MHNLINLHFREREEKPLKPHLTEQGFQHEFLSIAKRPNITLMVFYVDRYILGFICILYNCNIYINYKISSIYINYQIYSISYKYINKVES